MKGCVICVVKWCWNSDNNTFPPVRVIFLAGTCFFFFTDIGIDIWTAYEHYKAYKDEGSRSALDYFIATVFFILFPSILINVISLALYIWGQCMRLDCNKRNYHSISVTNDTYHMESKHKFTLIQWENQLRTSVLNRLPKHNRKGSITSTVPMLPALNVTENIELQDMTNSESSNNNNGVVITNEHSIAAADDDSLNVEEHRNEVRDENEEEREDTPPQSLLRTQQDQEIIEDTDNIPEFYPIDKFNSLQFILIVLLHIFQFGFIVRVCILLYNSRKDGLSFDRYRDLSFLRLMEGFFEAAPQLLLQLYVVTLEEIPDVSRKWITGIAVVFSMCSLALAIADYISAGKDILHYNPVTDNNKRQRLTWSAYFLVIFWHLAMIISRGISISLFATEYYSYVFIIGFGHYLLMVYWLYKEAGTAIFKTNKGLQEQKSILCGHYGFELLAAVFNIFFPFRLRDEDSLSFLTSYYTVFFFENLLMIILWVVHVDYTKKFWYLEVAPITVLVTFVIGILIMMLYYAKCQPSLEEIHEDDGEGIDGSNSFVFHQQPLTITCSGNRMYCDKKRRRRRYD